jgi:nucleotide-binding universal stress UspA family protein
MLPSLKTVLYATDLGRHAPRVLRYALSLARSYDGRVVIVHAVEPLGAAARHLVELYAGREDIGHAEQSRWPELELLLRGRLRSLCEGEECTSDDGRAIIETMRILPGRPDEVILGEAARIAPDVIVLGSHGHTTVGEILLGSTAHRVSQRATVPVLLVRTDEADTGSGL